MTPFLHIQGRFASYLAGGLPGDPADNGPPSGACVRVRQASRVRRLRRLVPCYGGLGSLWALLPWALCLVALSACSERSQDAGASSGVLKVVIKSAPETLDRRYALSATAQRLSSLITPGLLRIDAKGAAIPDLAEHFERVGEKRYRFTLREGLKFHDGSVVEPEDVVFSFESLKDPALGSPLGPKYKEISAVRAVGPRSIEIELSRVFAPILLDLTVGIIPRPRPGLPAGAREAPIGAGPYRFVSHPNEETLILAPFEQVYGGAPGVKELRFEVVRDETTRVLAALHGEIDLLPTGVSPVLLPRLKASPLLKVEQRPGAAYAYLAFNLRHPILKKLAVREAIGHALDRDTLIRYKFRGAARKTESMFPEGHWARATLPPMRFDPERAKQLLDEAGYPDPDGDGPLKRFTLNYKTSTDRFRKSVALVIASELEAVGIGIRLEAYEWGTFYGDIKRGRFELMSLSWTPVIEPHLMQWVFHSDSIPTAENHWTGGNRGGYRNPELDALIDAAANTLDLKARRKDYVKAQQILAKDLPYISLWHEDQIAIRSTRVLGFAPSPFGFWRPLAKVSLAP